MSHIVAAMLVMVFSLTAFGFGEPGDGGYSGNGGHNGQDGEDVSLVLDGRALELRLDGTDGTPGGNATNGEAASGCWFSPGVGREYGAAGGSGGHGGDGGSGGHGGNAIFFVKKFSDLSAVFLSQIGGKGAPGGAPGLGGAGCGCHTYSWTAQTCNTRRVCRNGTECSETVTCTDRTFTCTPGENGHNGNPGAHGANGAMGTIHVVQNLTALPEETPRGEISLRELKEKPLALSKLMWDAKTGAKKLFASGSNVQDNYFQFVKRAERSLILDWKVNRQFSDFLNEKFAVVFDGSRFALTYLGQQFLKTSLIEGESNTVLLIDEAFRQEDIMLVSYAGIAGIGKDTVITLKDMSGLGARVKNSVVLTYSFKHWLKGWVTEYEDTVPAELIEVSESGISVKVGKLDLNEKSLKKGAKVRFQVTVKRTLETLSRDLQIPQQEETL